MTPSVTCRKYTNALRFRISIALLRKLKRESENPALEIEFSGHFYFPAERWVMIPRETYEKLTKETKDGKTENDQQK